MIFETGQMKERPLVYLAGAISKCEDGGLAWRLGIMPHLHKLGYDTFNPVTEQPKLSGVDKDLLRQQKLTDLNLYKESCHKVVDVDLKVLKKCSLVVCKLDDNVFGGAGTFGELTVARYLEIPVFAWIDFRAGMSSVPDWAMGCITKFSLSENDFYNLIPAADYFVQKEAEKLDDVCLDDNNLPDY